MAEAVIFALIASVALPLGAWIGAWRAPSRRVTAGLLAFASGALISAIAFELFDDAVEHGGTVQAGVAFFIGASAFIVVDTWLDRRTERRGAAGEHVGFALLAGVTLDGLPENLAMGIGLIESSNPALLVAIFASNLPEAIVGAKRMLESGLGRRRVLAVWSATSVILGVAVVVGYGAFGDLDQGALAWPLGFAAGAVLASLADTLMPEAYEQAKHDPRVAYFTALGFLASFVIADL
jgi:ZIP family zinc transporter